MTKLIIKKKEDERVVTLEEDENGVFVNIDGDGVAKFYNNGTFKFWGSKNHIRFEGNWENKN